MRSGISLKLFECVLTAVAVCHMLLTAVSYFPDSHPSGLDLAIILIPIPLTVGFPFYWQRLERRVLVDSDRLHLLFQRMIRYWLAFQISVYGFAKILDIQFDIPAYVFDRTAGELSGRELTWFYFGFSYPLSASIGILQVLGSALLLFDRSRLLGYLLLLPVMVNVLFVNVFYSIAPGALLNSMLFLTGILFLVSIDRRKIIEVIWEKIVADSATSARHNTLRHVFGLLLLMGMAFWAAWHTAGGTRGDEALGGVWSVDSLSRNGKPIARDAWREDSLAWKRIYFAGRHGCAFSPNPYRYESGEGLYGTYEFDAGRHRLEAILKSTNGDKDTVNLQAVSIGDSVLNLQGTILGEASFLKLRRIR
jgi:hypothetical protein